ncbi:MAG: SDR family NAD(P)-dependent oxidoreductase [bacterium]|nr:SDR family NAD(P)-dependent oxidoreductase [bacterium]
MGPRPKGMVTGAASGIGEAVARRLLDEGCSVVAVDINERGLAGIADAGAEPLVADLADLEDRARVIEAGHGMDYLVNAAGIIRLKALSEFTVDDWRDIFTINAEAIFFLCQGIGPTMPPGSAIVNLSSSSAKLSNTVEAAIYAASKTTILSITRSFAYGLAKIPVRVNAVCPAIIDTPMQDRVLEQVAPLRGMTVEELTVARNASVPLGRTASAEELAGLIWFLLGEKPGYMTGQSVNYGGGYVTW